MQQAAVHPELPRTTAERVGKKREVSEGTGSMELEYCGEEPQFHVEIRGQDCFSTHQLDNRERAAVCLDLLDALGQIPETEW